MDKMSVRVSIIRQDGAQVLGVAMERERFICGIQMRKEGTGVSGIGHKDIGFRIYMQGFFCGCFLFSFGFYRHGDEV